MAFQKVIGKFRVNKAEKALIQQDMLKQAEMIVMRRCINNTLIGKVVVTSNKGNSRKGSHKAQGEEDNDKFKRTLTQRPSARPDGVVDRKLMDRHSSKRKTATYLVTPEKSRHSMGSLNAELESDDDGSEYRRTNGLYGSIAEQINLPVITEESEEKDRYKDIDIQNTDIEIVGDNDDME